MPPEENKNNNIPIRDTFQVGGIDPVFKGNQNPIGNVIDRNAPLKTTSPEVGGAYGILKNQTYTPSTPSPTTTFSKPIENKPAAPKSIVRTYKGDLETAIQAEHLSSINIAIAENQKMHNKILSESGQPSATQSSDYSKNKIIIFISLILIMAGIIGVGLVYFFNNKQASPVIVTQELPSLITTEYKDELNIDTIAKDKFIDTLSGKLNDSQIKVNNFDNVYLTTGSNQAKRMVTSSEFISLIKFKMPDILKRTLLPDFMVGVYSFGKNLPFVILKTSYFENAYTGMLGWENDLEEDFQVLFRLSGYENSGRILDSLTPTNLKKFEDAVVINKDIRLLRDDNGQIIFLYGIIDKETIIITVSDTAFKEIINRLNKEKGLKR